MIEKTEIYNTWPLLKSRFTTGSIDRGLVIKTSANAFVFKVVTAGADTFQLPIYNGGTYNFHVNWGDGGSDIITAWGDAAANHSYAGAGTYTVRITGTINGWRFNNAGDKTLIHDISSWGPLLLGNSDGYFYNCSNLTVSATDILDVSSITTFFTAFRGCSSLTALDVSAWNTASVTTFNRAFRGCSSLTALDVSVWNTASVTAFSYVFYNCSALTALAANNWDITAVTDMTDMLSGVTLSTINYSNIIIAWEGQAVNHNVVFHGGNSMYSAGAAATARQALINDHAWTITDGGQAP